MTITDLKYEDEGIFRCTVNDFFGNNNSANAYLNVFGKQIIVI